MRFAQIDGLDVVTRIAGPIHHFLGVEFGRGPAGPPAIERVGLDGAPREAASQGASPDEVRREVDLGVAAVNERLRSDLAARRIRYCVDDPATPGVYEKLAEALAERATIDWSPTSDEDIDAVAAQAFAAMDREEAGAEAGEGRDRRPDR